MTVTGNSFLHHEKKRKQLDWFKFKKLKLQVKKNMNKINQISKENKKKEIYWETKVKIKKKCRFSYGET